MAFSFVDPLSRHINLEAGVTVEVGKWDLVQAGFRRVCWVDTKTVQTDLLGGKGATCVSRWKRKSQSRGQPLQRSGLGAGLERKRTVG